MDRANRDDLANRVHPNAHQVGMFHAIAFEREISNGTGRVETAVAIVMGDLTEGGPSCASIRCFTGEVLGSLRCDCNDQLEIAMRAIAEEGRGLVIYEYQEGAASV